MEENPLDAVTPSPLERGKGGEVKIILIRRFLVRVETI